MFFVHGFSQYISLPARAAFMAAAHAKFTGELGVCLSTGGPGATHLITGLYDAKSDHVPVLAIAGQAEVTVRLEEDGKTVNGLGADADTLVASARAYLSALNKLQSKAERVAAQG
mgnify:CR=1 FL=1